MGRGELRIGGGLRAGEGLQLLLGEESSRSQRAPALEVRVGKRVRGLGLSHRAPRQRRAGQGGPTDEPARRAGPSSPDRLGPRGPRPGTPESWPRRPPGAASGDPSERAPPPERLRARRTGWPRAAAAAPSPRLGSPRAGKREQAEAQEPTMHWALLACALGAVAPEGGPRPQSPAETECTENDGRLKNYSRWPSAGLLKSPPCSTD